MTTITQYFEQAQMSLAAYAAGLTQGMFGGTDLNSPYVKALTDAGMSATQAATFANTYTVVSQSGGLGSLTGFSATLFQNTQTGQKYFAIRGTELGIGLDLWADATIAFGNPFLNLQIPALVSFYDQLKTDGLITSSDSITVSGHSLGGYLAQLLTMYDPAQISQTYTYNAPGFTGASALAASLLQLYMGTASGSNIPAQLTNVQGMGPNIIAGLGNMIGGEQAVFTEGTTHSIAALTDSLALYNLFATLDPSLNTASADNIAKLTGFLKASSNVAANSLEYTLDALRTLLQTDYTTGSANYLSSATAIDDREALYANLKSLTDTLAASSFNLGTAQAPQYGFTLLTLDEAAGSSGLAAAAKTDLATCYALYQGNPFVLDATGYDLYTNINANGALTIYDAATHTGELTDAYLKDRAAFLLAKVKANTDDASVTVSGANIGHDAAWAKQGGEEVFYQDKVSSPGNVFPGYSTAEIYQGNNTAGIQALTNSQLNDIKQIQFGSSLSDTLAGGNKDDHLYGGAGNDTLTGGKGNDYLEGGKGLDTYLYTNGGNNTDGLDTILDTDGQGSIKVDGATPLTGGNQYGDNHVFRGSDANGANHLYTFVTGDRASGGDLIVDGVMLIKDYRPNSGNGMGLTLGAAVVEANPVTVNTFVGDPLIHTVTIAPGGEGANWRVVGSPYNPQKTAVDDGNGGTVDVVTAYDVDYYLIDIPTGNPVEGGGPERADSLIGTTANDHIISGAGNDTINAIQGGNDLIEAGSGRDTVYAGAGNNVIIGGADGDILVGGAGDDRIYADTQTDAATAIAQGNVQTGSGLQGDWLAGGSGDDTLVGSTGNDVLSGGGGSDLLIGGAGGDYIMGDVNAVTTRFDWALTNINGTESFYPTLALPAAAGEADVIYAGAGDDHVWGGIGNDVIFGEGGNDIVLFWRRKREAANDETTQAWRVAA